MMFQRDTGRWSGRARWDRLGAADGSSAPPDEPGTRHGPFRFPADPGLAIMSRRGRAHRMTLDDLKRARDHRPFRPFAVKLADGSQVRVGHPECIAGFPAGRQVIIFNARAVHVLRLAEAELVIEGG